jgi:hypothetical protein
MVGTSSYCCVIFLWNGLCDLMDPALSFRVLSHSAAQDIEPAFVRSVWPSVAGDLQSELLKTARFLQQAAERGFREIRKDSAVSVSFRVSVFEGRIEDAVQFQSTANQVQHWSSSAFLVCRIEAQAQTPSNASS